VVRREGRPVTSPDVIVIGAGVAGLAAATALAGRGARVAVVEARPSLGGRAGSYTDPATGKVVDNGQHILMGCYRESFAFLRRIGAAGNVKVQPSLEVPFVDTAGRRTTLACPPLPSPYHLLGGIIEWDAIRWRDRLSVLRMGPVIRTARRQLEGRTTNVAASPEETVENWLIRNGQTARIREMLWNPLALAALNQPPDEAAAPPFVRVLAEMFGPDPSASAIGLPVLPLSETYAEPARRYIEARGGDVRTNARVRVIVQHGRVAGVRVRDRETVSAPAVIASVPWFAVADLFDQVPAAIAGVVHAASQMGAYPIVTVNLWLDRPVMSTPFLGLPERNMQWVFDRRRIAGATGDGVSTRVPRQQPAASSGRETGCLVSLVSSGAVEIAALSNAAIAAIAWRELREAVPAARLASVTRATVVRERRATFSLAPGQPARPSNATALPGFVLAGDWTDTGLPGTIESAALSGHRAADLILRGQIPKELDSPTGNPLRNLTP
jgi:squalene-associated FAD-dependent desaturase